MIVLKNIITADNGMVLTDGEVYSKQVYLGKWDSPENWREIPDEDLTEPDDYGENSYHNPTIYTYVEDE